jgi:hypothetical protein
MKKFNRAVTTAVIGMALALGGAATANAEKISFNATPGQFEAACKKAGGAYFPGAQTNSGAAGCVTSDVIAECDDNGSCTAWAAPTRRQPGGPSLPELVAAAGIAG